jgi:rhodanese-related sulfurtransferase
MCRTGSRAAKACRRLSDAGLTVFNIEGGLQAWESAGLPVVRGRKGISIERQVRIAAGALVLLGVLLGWFVSPYFLGISAFVGAGLIFAGVTDTCGMGMMLARMPWNMACASEPGANVSSSCDAETEPPGRREREPRIESPGA